MSTWPRRLATCLVGQPSTCVFRVSQTKLNQSTDAGALRSPACRRGERGGSLAVTGGDAASVGAETRPHGPRLHFQTQIGTSCSRPPGLQPRGAKALPPASPPTPRGFAPCSAPDLTLRVDSSLTASFTCNETSSCEVSNSTILSKFSELCSHNRNPVLEHSYRPTQTPQSHL